MRVSRVYTDQPLSAHSELALDERNSHYLLRVLRLKSGDALILFNGDGHEYEAVLEQAGKKSARVRIGEQSAPRRESALHVELGQGVARGERMDFVLQKSVELGVAAITPLWTQRAQVRMDARRQEKRLGHWRGVVQSACEQSGRVRLPALDAPRDLGDWLARPFDGLRLVLAPEATQTLDSLPAPARVQVLIGPEGGLDASEIQAATSHGFQPVRLGPRVLRTETAALTAIAAVQLLWGDLGAQSSGD